MKNEQEKELRELFSDGLEFYKKGLYSEALKRWQAVLSLDPKYPNIEMYMNVARREEAHILSLASSSVLDQADDEVLILDEIERAKEAFLQHRQLKEDSKAEQILESLFLQRQKDPAALAFLIRTWISLGLHKKAKDACRLLFEIKPYSARSWFLGGTLFFATQEYQKAKSCFEKANRLRPKVFEIINNLGAVCMALKETREAREWFLRALEIDGDNSRLRSLCRILAQENKQNDQDLLLHYEKLTQEKPWPDLFYKIAELHRQNGDLEKACDAYLRAIDLNPSYRQALYAFGCVLLQMEEYEKSLEIFKKILPLMEIKQGVLENISQFERAGYLEESACALAKALRMEPDYASVHISLGRDYYQSGEIEKAFAEISKGVNLASHYPDGQYYLGLCYLALKQEKKASECLFEALSLNPFYVRAAIELSLLLSKNQKREDAINVLLRILSCMEETDEKKEVLELLQTLNPKSDTL